MYEPRPRRVSRALLVGGGTRVSSVRRLVERATGVPADCRLDPEQCVAFGAVIRAGLLTGELTGVELGDGAYVADVHGRSSGFMGVTK
jgi:molecular chaperone DnaK (HSP70)